MHQWAQARYSLGKDIVNGNVGKRTISEVWAPILNNYHCKSRQATFKFRDQTHVQPVSERDRVAEHASVGGEPAPQVDHVTNQLANDLGHRYIFRPRRGRTNYSA